MSGLIIYVGVVFILAQSALSATNLDRFSEETVPVSTAVVETDSFRIAIEESQVAVRRLRYAMLPVTVGCAVANSVPFIGPNCEGYNSIFAIFDTVVMAAAQTLDSADELQMGRRHLQRFEGLWQCERQY